VRIRFLTATPLDISRGSGTYVGISMLARALETLGHSVAFETPRRKFPIYTLGRLWFNRGLKPSRDFDLTVGFDMDGYRIAAGNRHVAALKGVIADEVRFESGSARWTMSIQARCERLHVHRAARVLVTSQYSADRATELYRLRAAPIVVPEPIDLAEWRAILARNPAPSEPFTVLFVGRFYRRKRVDVLLRAAALLRSRISDFKVRIVGNGPCNDAWRALARELHLDGAVAWLGDVTRAQLAAEYNRASAFCLPSVQEGFGIVLLEAMAAGKPIAAARAAAIPEVAPCASFADPDSPGSLADAIERIAAPASSSDVARMREEGFQIVELYDALPVARRFLDAATVP
jgi:glycosyltransferase involved in cell wall biosynthesis